jgi:5'-nucleotidase
MKILLCNDDGIEANGIEALYDALIDHHQQHGGPLGEVFTVAPLTVQSATGHGITFRQPLITREIDVNERLTGIAVDGRPADCVKLALSSLWPARFGPGTRPDLVVSGMNQGANVGINVLYSGTVAAALEAAFLGVPSIAVSLHLGRGKPRWDVAARHARECVDRVLAAARAHTGGAARTASGLESHACLSINLPVTEADGPTPPVRVCPMNVHGMIDAYRKGTNPLGEDYYWADGAPMEFHATEPGSDVQELFNRCITVTPLKYDLTDYAGLSAWKGRLGG